MQISELYKLFKQTAGVCTDSRNIIPGGIFFALKGPHFNGNAFARQALADGAAFAVIDEKEFYLDERTVLVEHVLDTLQQLALHHRQQFSIPVLAITGSNGKTTTKELVHAVLSTTYRTHTTKGNLNNHIGIPLTLLEMKEDTEIAVIEMGANHQREIAGYCSYTLPTHGIITNCGKAHLEGFGGEEGVRKGKGELYDFLRSHEGTAFINGDYDYLKEMSKGIPHVYSYGTTGALINGQITATEPFLELHIEGSAELKLATQLVGAYNLPNVLVAVAVGRYFKVSDEQIRKAIAGYAPSNSRSQLIHRGKQQIILDAYNANPTSMRAAIESFAASHYPNKVLILGAMAELGAESEREHRSIVELIQQYTWKQVVLVGGDFQKITHPFQRFDDSAAAANWCRQQDWEDACLLIKGSRSMKMERILEE
jgi:UDP-N-acetylmuramoyl-tripeptide--D-alanyl-D-alanine ligase